MTNFIQPQTDQEKEALTRAIIESADRYRAARDTPAPYIPPAPAPEAKQDFEIQPRHVKAVAFLGGGLAIGYSVVAFVATYAVEIGAVVGVVALVGLLVSGLKKSEHGANVRTTSGTTEAKQTTINIHVAADGGRVEVKQ